MEEVGSLSEGPLFDGKCKLQRAVRWRVGFCAAQAEKRRKDVCFWTFSVKANFFIDGKVVSDPQTLMVALSHHFGKANQELLAVQSYVRTSFAKSCEKSGFPVIEYLLHVSWRRLGRILRGKLWVLRV